jgi:NAD(P)-dependent dehydrogenase (short-subunit alcohol dehydrogenase family)
MQQVVLITGASSGFGLLSAKALARAGHIVYASMRETKGKNAKAVAEVAAFASDIVSTSILQRMAPRSSQVSPIGCVPKCCAGSALKIS